MERPLDPSIDILLEFPKECRIDLMHLHDPLSSVATKEGPPPDPHGVGGGGIRFPGARKKDIWEPLPQLVGIQVGYHRSMGLLRGTGMGRWLALVAKAFPDVQKEVEEAMQRRSSGFGAIPAHGGGA